MVNYHEGDPTVPGNAELEPHEVSAFEVGDVSAVSKAGKEYGTTCTDYAVSHGGELSDIVLGMRTLMDQPRASFTSFGMGLPFMEGVETGTMRRIAEIRDAQPRLELAQGMAALASFGKRPEVQRVIKKQEEAAFDNLMSAAQAINNSPE